MIYEEELIPLIRNRETIYCVERGYEIKELKLNGDFGFGYFDLPYDFTRCLKQQLYTYFDEDGDECEANEYYLFHTLYKTKKEAEWAAKMHDKKTITFEPPLYEQIKDGQPYKFNFTANGKHYNFFASVLLIELLEVNEEYCCNEQLICQSSTKENYIKAVEYAKGLFRGDKPCE